MARTKATQHPANNGEITVQPFVHPSMQMPFPLQKRPVTIDKAAPIFDLMTEFEANFAECSADAGMELDFQITTIWNITNPKQALNPDDPVGRHFLEGDTFGIYGDIVPSIAPKLDESDKMPVTILTGFLGAGKTTLLNYILGEQREKKIAVIENEFGDVSIDDSLLSSNKVNVAEQIVVMDNGCMCCTIRGDLVESLLQILDKINEGKQIDCIMIETTGMADPVPIVRTFMERPDVTEELRLDGVVTVADAKNLTKRLDDDIQKGKVNEAYQQIAFADKIILNKLDLITTEEAIAVKNRIRDINKFAKILPAVKGRVDLKELSNMRAHDVMNFAEEDIAKAADIDPKLVGESDPAPPVPEPSVQPTKKRRTGGLSLKKSFARNESRHDGRVNSFSIVKEGEVDPDRLEIFLGRIAKLPAKRGTIFRVKAIFAVMMNDFKQVYHQVMDATNEENGLAWGDDEKKVCKIVFIGKTMDEPYLRGLFESMFLPIAAQVPLAGVPSNLPVPPLVPDLPAS